MPGQLPRRWSRARLGLETEIVRHDVDVAVYAVRDDRRRTGHYATPPAIGGTQRRPNQMVQQGKSLTLRALGNIRVKHSAFHDWRLVVSWGLFCERQIDAGCTANSAQRLSTLYSSMRAQRRRTYVRPQCRSPHHKKLQATVSAEANSRDLRE